MSGFVNTLSTGVGLMQGATANGTIMPGFAGYEEGDLPRARYNWNYYKRTNDSVYQQTDYCELWPAATLLSGGAAGLAMIGQDSSNGLIGDNSYEGWSASTGGAHRDFFIVGSVQNNSGAALAACNLDLFLVSPKQYVASGISDQNGNFMLPTPFNAQAHEIYANYANGTYVGGSVNTLTPNF